jgi:hypothetical protein
MIMLISPAGHIFGSVNSIIGQYVPFGQGKGSANFDWLPY